MTNVFQIPRARGSAHQPIQVLIAAACMKADWVKAHPNATQAQLDGAHKDIVERLGL
jgi:hypothetical protein